jgi:hypothetical protein
MNLKQPNKGFIKYYFFFLILLFYKLSTIQPLLVEPALRRPSNQCLESFRKTALRLHNEFRSNHSAIPLQEEQIIDGISQAYAEKLASQEMISLVHSSTETYGENLGVYFNSSVNPMQLCSGEHRLLIILAFL